VGLAVKHQQLARHVGGFGDDHRKNLIAPFNFNHALLDKGTTFIFGSWVCIANGSSGFHSHLANPMESEASSSAPRSDLDELVENPGKILIPESPGRLKKYRSLTRL
jgi:hypothetical protein